jgi:hypothetical protein
MGTRVAAASVYANDGDRYSSTRQDNSGERVGQLKTGHNCELLGPKSGVERNGSA